MAAGLSVCTGSVSVGCSILPSDMKLYVAITLWPLKESFMHFSFRLVSVVVLMNVIQIQLKTEQKIHQQLW